MSESGRLSSNYGPPQLCGSSLGTWWRVCRTGRSWELSVARGKGLKLFSSNMFSGEELRRCLKKKIHVLIFNFLSIWSCMVKSMNGA